MINITSKRTEAGKARSGMETMGLGALGGLTSFGRNVVPEGGDTGHDTANGTDQAADT